MNRRELFARLSVLGAMFGINSKVKAIESEPMPLCLVVTMDRDCCDISLGEAERMKSIISERIGPDCPPILILTPGVDMKAVHRAPEEAIARDTRGAVDAFQGRFRTANEIRAEREES